MAGNARYPIKTLSKMRIRLAPRHCPVARVGPYTAAVTDRPRGEPRKAGMAG